MVTTETLKTPHGNRIFMQRIPKGYSRARYGIIISYSDVYARTADKQPKFSFDTGIKELYYQFYDSLHYYGKPDGFGYIKAKEVLINPVGDLHSRRYFITDKGKKRLERLKIIQINRIKQQHKDERKRLKSSSCAITCNK
jgi:hypothetical protein